MSENKIYAWHYFLAFMSANVLFALVFLFANSVSFLNYQETNMENNLIKEYISDLKDISVDCSSDKVYFASEKLDQIGAKLNLLETRFNKNDERVLEQKEIYSSLEYQHYLIINSSISNCNSNFKVLFFFYSNSEESIDESEGVGIILSTLKNRYPEKVMIYSFDYNLEDDLINELKKRYSVLSAPKVIFEGKTLEFDDLETLENIVFES